MGKLLACGGSYFYNREGHTTQTGGATLTFLTHDIISAGRTGASIRRDYDKDGKLLGEMSLGTTPVVVLLVY